MAITFWNNWRQTKEFILLDIHYNDGAYSFGFLGFGMVLVF